MQKGPSQFGDLTGLSGTSRSEKEFIRKLAETVAGPDFLITKSYFKPERSAAMMVGSLQDADDTTDIESCATTPTCQEIETLSDAILRRFPIMDDGAARRGWTGLSLCERI